MSGISSYLHELSTSMGMSAAETGEEEIAVLELEVVREEIFVLAGLPDGIAVYRLPSPDPIFSLRSIEPVNHLRLVRSGGAIRNLGFVHVGSPEVVRFLDLFSGGETFHLLRMTSEVVLLKASISCFAVCVFGGRIHLFKPDSLEEVFSVQNMPSPVPPLALGERWAAYNLSPQPRTNVPSPKGSLSVWDRISSMGQDALDNLVIAVVSDRAERRKCVLSSPVARSAQTRNSMIAIRDVVTMKVISVIEEATAGLHNRGIEVLAWSSCGTQLMVTSGNGHFIQIHAVTSAGGRKQDPGTTNNLINFHLLHSLNRGVTPAVLSSLALSGDLAAAASSNGTVHLFDLTSGERVVKLRSDPRPVVAFSQAHQLVLVSRGKFTVQTFHGQEEVEKIQLARRWAEGGEGPKLQLVEGGAVGRSVASNAVELAICRPMEVPFWMSPNIRLVQVLESTVRVGAPTSPLRFATPLLVNGSFQVADENYFPSLHSATLERLALALATPLNEDPPVEEKYLTSTKEGFVQVVPA